MAWKEVTMDDPLAGTVFKAHEFQQAYPNLHDGIVKATITPYKDGPGWFAVVMWGTKLEPEGGTNMRLDERFENLDEAKAWSEQQIKAGPLPYRK